MGPGLMQSVDKGGDQTLCTLGSAPSVAASSRFARQSMMREMGAGRQRRLADSKVLIVGMGGLGCPAAQYLVAAGIGTLVLVDHDSVEITNLNRQILFQEDDIGKSKVRCAAARLQALSSATRIEATEGRVDATNVLALVGACDVVLDCTDNLRTRYLIGDACAMLQKPCVSAAVSGFDGQLAVFSDAVGSPCYRCAFPNPPDVSKIGNCASGGVIGAFVGVLGSMQALEAIKVIAKFDQPAQSQADLPKPDLSQPGNVMRCINGLSGEVTELRIPKRPDCRACSAVDALKHFHELHERQTQVSVVPSIDAAAFRERIGLGPQCSPGELGKVRVFDVRTADEFAAGHVRGAQNVSLADILAHSFDFSADDEIIFYCASGSRSLAAAEYLIKLGFRAPVHLNGGMSALWNDSDLIEEGGMQPERTPLAHHPDHFGGLKPRHCGAGDPAPA
jgi:molybdopterin/thiamine biosynthesis adenylyltransferase/rhodanese-related sulfurtransferase